MPEKQFIKVTLVGPDQGSNPLSTALEARTLTIPPPTWLVCQGKIGNYRQTFFFLFILHFVMENIKNVL